MQESVIIGSSGFVGTRLAAALLIHNPEIKLYLIDLKPIAVLNQNATLLPCDITNKALVDAAFLAVPASATVFHLASYGMSSSETANVERIENVNISGTRYIIDACISRGITKLIYTSTSNVIFGGNAIDDGTEALPYFPLQDHTDAYSQSKAIAEQLVLHSDLNALAIRSSAIYGKGEQRHLPRICAMIRTGMAFAKFGNGTVQDWIHVDDLVSVHLLAGLKVSDKLRGQAYFVSEGKPVNSIEMMYPIYDGCSVSRPQIEIPLLVMYMIAILCELFYKMILLAGVERPKELNTIWDLFRAGPILSRQEVNKSGVTHTFSNAKALRDLDWEPKVDPESGRLETFKWLKESGYFK